MLSLYSIEMTTTSLVVAVIFVAALGMNIYYYRKSIRLMQDIAGDTEKESSRFRVNLPQHAVVQLLAFTPSLVYATIAIYGDFFEDDYTSVPDFFTGLAGLGNVVVYFIQKRSAKKRDNLNELENYDPQRDEEYIRKDSLYAETYIAMYSDP